jgi:D-3-phosphoglycerate dehydrogenase
MRFDAPRLDTLRKCKVIVRYGVGVDNVDVAAARARDIVVANVPDYCVEEVATHALAMMLALDRDLLALNATVHDGRWEMRPGVTMRRPSTCILGIIGFGRIGEALGRRARALGMSVVATDPLRSAASIETAGARPVELDELLEISDFVSVHAAKSHGGATLLDASAIRRMKRGAYVVNVARGGLVDETALAAALWDGALAGAGLDVIEPEPPPADSPILVAPNVIVTPHSAWYSISAVADLRRLAADEAARVLSGMPALNAVLG